MDIIPEGDPPSSPGLLYSATLGGGGRAPNPNRVVAYVMAKRIRLSRNVMAGEFMVPFAQSNATTPLGLANSPAVPRVAEYGNPGLEDGSPSGKMSKL